MSPILSPSRTKFYQEDLVKHKTKDDYMLVMRCWHDAEDYPPDPNDPDPMMRPLSRGQFGAVRVIDGERCIEHETDYTLVDRSFQAGDLCKRSLDDVHSGVIVNESVESRLCHAITRQDVPGWKTLDDISGAIDVDVGDLVTVADWIGTIEEIYDEVVVESSNGSLLKFADVALGFHVGDNASDFIPDLARSPLSAMMSLFRSRNDTVVSVTHKILAVAWTAINQSLPFAEAQSRTRPKTFWYGEDLATLTLVRARAEQALHVGAKLVLKDPPPGFMTLHGQADDPLGPIEVRTFAVKETRTTVKVLWQDGTEEIVLAIDLHPHLNPDEYDCWPGDHVIWKGEDQSRVAVVQKINAAERIATVRFIDCDGEALQDVSVLELDLHGGGEWGSSVAPESLGVRRGDFVFLHPEGATNGAATSVVPQIGETEPWTTEACQNEGGRFTGWRGVMQELGLSLRNIEEVWTPPHGTVRRPGSSTMNWFGEVVNLRLDGSVDVSLADGSITNLPIQRLTKLYEGGEQIDEILDEISDGEGSHLSEGDDELFVEVQNETGQWEVHDGRGDHDDEWEDEDEDDMDIDQSSSPAVPQTQSTGTALQDLSNLPEPPTLKHEDIDRADPSWKLFEILPEAPQDHAFYNTSFTQRHRQFFSRLNKEYRALESSLPDSIIVRAYEDRTDLLRSLIVGPENTPYEDAPFVIDWHLGDDFPQSPPVAHFWSWTNGNGRVNPNLYEEGKVCLSILGTWAGDQSESWSPARSSLLQALVSIQGLVLVKEPWFCEPAYDKLRGTDEGVVNSRLYNEKAFILSRGFVRRALEFPLGSLESEIAWLYRKKGRLRKVIQDCQTLIERSGKTSEDCGTSDAAVPKLSAGGIITLSRTLTKLRSLPA